MMNRGNMGKEISTAPKSKKVKKMMMGGMADGARRPAVMPPRPGMPGTMGPGSGMPPRPGMGAGPKPPSPGMVMPPRPAVMPPRPGTLGPGSGMAGGMPPKGMPGPMVSPGTPQAGAMEAMFNRRAAGMKKGGKVAKKADGGAVKGYAKGGMASRGDGCCMKGKTKGAMK